MSDDEILQKLVDWIIELGHAEPPESDIIAFNFGLFESADEGYRLYLSGSRIFDPGNHDWACDQDYYPGGRYFDHNFNRESSWEAMLEHAISLTSRYCQSCQFEKSFLCHAKAITVGFDDGELQRIH